MAMISQKVERQVVLLDENKSAWEAAALMVDKHIGSVVVARESQVIGLFTERDLTRHVIRERRSWCTTTTSSSGLFHCATCWC